MRRHELRSTVMTSNRPFEEWGKLIGDVPTATAILARMLHRAEIIQITGKSYRLKDRAYKKKKEDKRMPEKLKYKLRLVKNKKEHIMIRINNKIGRF